MVENSQVQVATGTIGTRAVSEKYPVDEGITAGTTKQRTDGPSLKAETKAMESSWGCV